MKAVAVSKRSRGVRVRQRTLLHLVKGIEKPTKEYERHLGSVLHKAQQPMSQNLWALDVLNRQDVTSEDFQVIAAESARLSHHRRRNAITVMEIVSAVRGLRPAQCQGCPVTGVPRPVPNQIPGVGTERTLPSQMPNSDVTR